MSPYNYKYSNLPIFRAFWEWDNALYIGIHGKSWDI